MLPTPQPCHIGLPYLHIQSPNSLHPESHHSIGQNNILLTGHGWRGSLKVQIYVMYPALLGLWGFPWTCSTWIPPMSVVFSCTHFLSSAFKPSSYCFFSSNLHAPSHLRDLSLSPVPHLWSRDSNVLQVVYGITPFPSLLQLYWGCAPSSSLCVGRDIISVTLGLKRPLPRRWLQSRNILD